MLPAASEIMLLALRAQIMGMMNESPAKLKFVFRGEAFVCRISSPTVSFHQGTKNEIIMSKMIEMLPARPNQLILLGKVFHLIGLEEW